MQELVTGHDVGVMCAIAAAFEDQYLCSTPSSDDLEQPLQLALPPCQLEGYLRGRAEVSWSSWYAYIDMGVLRTPDTSQTPPRS